MGLGPFDSISVRLARLVVILPSQLHTPRRKRITVWFLDLAISEDVKRTTLDLVVIAVKVVAA